MSLEDFLGIDENNLAVTLLLPKSAQLRCSCRQAEAVGSKIITEFDKETAAIAFAPFAPWRLPNRQMNPGGMKGAGISSQEMCKQCSKQKLSLARVGWLVFFLKSCRV